MKYTYLTLFMMLISMVGCNKDFESEDVTSTKTIPGGVTVIGEVNGSVTGYVYNDNGEPVPGAQVNTYSAQTTTSPEGVFSFENIKLDPNGTYITVNKDGYMLGSDKVYPASGTLYSAIQMIQLSRDKSFQAEQGGRINAEKGGAIIFQPNSIASADGEPFEGEVFVTARFIGPDDKDISDLMPGDLVADDAEGRTVVLATGGMMAVELRDDQGRELNLREGSTAIIQMPYTSNDLPEEIKLWSFDESKGRWQEEGIAVKEGDSYIAEVSHFSFWNCDVPYPLIQLCGKVVTEDGSPVKTKVYITVDGIGTGHGYTDSNGEFCGKVPKGEVLDIRVRRTLCQGDQVVFTTGPYDDDVVLNDVVLEDYIPNISGEIVCNGEEYNDVTILFESNLGTYVISPRGRGNFNINLNTFCDEITEASIRAINTNTNLLSPSESININDPSFVTIEVCEDPCDFTGEIDISCFSDTLTARVLNGAGTYTYEWSTGATGQSITVSGGRPQLYCVTITETTQGCEVPYCVEAAEGVFGFQLGYDPCANLVDVRVSGGVPPFEVTGDVTRTFDNTFATLFPSVPDGQFCITITDAIGCVAQECIDVFPAEIPYVDARASSCQDSIYSFSSTFYDYAELRDELGNRWPVNNYPLDINVLDIGFSFKTIELVSPDGCFAEWEIRVPFFNGIEEVIPSNTSCQGCQDGGIELVIDPNASCFECVYGGFIVIDSQGQNVTSQAQQFELSPGSYNLVAIDSMTTCYIAARDFEIR